ncbi:winged helix-turn-helix transcriptional regulator [Kutzneria kofuensis]|uniref:winged helix-turn-helix transcriptional regulator n=1 Tax=Kutzneria kofuensis TaxID=103725 RepID=UPI0031E7D1AA
MSGRRSYDDGCATAHALDLVGERWALLVVRELLLGPKRFTDLRVGLPGISPNVLSQRLRELEQVGVVKRGRLTPPAAASVYELTEWGHELERVILALGRWACRSPMMAHDAASAPTRWCWRCATCSIPARPGGSPSPSRLCWVTTTSVCRSAAPGARSARGAAANRDLVVRTDATTLNALLWGGRDLTEALRAGDVRITGPVEPVATFLTLFPLPEPMPLTGS